MTKAQVLDKIFALENLLASTPAVICDTRSFIPTLTRIAADVAKIEPDPEESPTNTENNDKPRI